MEKDPSFSMDQEIDFGSFVASLAASVLVHLGEAQEDMPDGIDAHLASARQVIDILGMLQAKTRGNLTHEEQGLLEEVLYDLRLKFLQSTKQQSEKKLL